MNPGAALTYDDTAGRDQFTTVAFYTQTFGIGIATISGTIACFFMCHGKLSLCRNASNLDFGVILPMSLMFLVMFTPPLLEITYLVMPALAQRGCLDRGAA